MPGNLIQAGGFVKLKMKATYALQRFLGLLWSEMKFNAPEKQSDIINTVLSVSIVHVRDFSAGRCSKMNSRIGWTRLVK